MKNYASLIGVGIAFVVGLVLVSAINPFVIIGPGKRGVVMNWGAVSNDVLKEGLHFRMPIVQKIQVIDVQIQKEEVTAGAASKDLQELSTVVALNYNLDPNKVNLLYQEIGLDYTSRIIDPAIQESVKSAAAKYTAEEAITKRQWILTRFSLL